MLKTCRFSTSIFWGSGLDFGASWASKSAALLAAPGVLKPTAFLLALTYCFPCLRRGEGIPKWRSEPPPVGPMLHYVGTFFVLGRLFLALGRLVRVCKAFFTHVRLFFRVLGRSGSDFRASGGNLEGPKLFFSVFCRARKSAMGKNCASAKTIVFPVFLYGFYILRASSSSHKTTQNHSRSLSNRASCKDCAPIASWGGFWKGLVLSGALLDWLLFALGRLLASLGHFLDALGRLLAALWSFTAAFRLPGPSQASIFKGLGTSQTEF